MRLKLSKFTKCPGPRLRIEGNGSGQEFLEDHLIPAMTTALSDEKILIVNIDNVAGYTMGFLEEVFGGLSRKFSPKVVMEKVVIECNDEPYLFTEIVGFIRTAKGKK